MAIPLSYELNPISQGLILEWLSPSLLEFIAPAIQKARGGMFQKGLAHNNKCNSNMLCSVLYTHILFNLQFTVLEIALTTFHWVPFTYKKNHSLMLFN